MDLTKALAGMLTGQQWRDEALCLQTDAEIFFPAKGASTQPAKRLCQRCPVRLDCLEHAIQRRENDGVWGGTSPRERRQIALQRTQHQPRPHNRPDRAA
jgi:WhiB family redox-sensing transcriptional regulator